MANPTVREPPIVLIHGIQGSQLSQTYDDSFDVIWSGIQNRFETILDLELDDRGEVERDPRDLIMVTRVERLVYGELLGRLRRQFPEAPVYIFRYDWRKDLSQTAIDLNAFFSLIEKKTGQPMCRVVTHSMGGLALAAYLQRSATQHLRRIQRAVITVPPFWGSIEAIRMLILGNAMAFGLNTPEVYRKIARSFPSVYELVPGYAGAWDHPAAQADIWDMTYWQRRVKFGTRTRTIYEKRDAVMQRHLQRAHRFHQRELIDFDALPAAERGKFLLLYGTGERTRVTLKVKPQNSTGEIMNCFDFDDHGVWSTEGDGTVPAASATRYQALPAIAIQLSDFSAWWPTLWDDKAKLALAGFHAMFLGLDKVQGLVCDWLDGKHPKASWADPIKP